MKMSRSHFGMLCLAAAFVAPVLRGASWAEEPIAIGTTPQLFVDDYLVDNRYALHNGNTELVVRRYHAPVKYEHNPVVVDPDPEITCTYQAVRYEPESKLFRMWYIAVLPVVREGENVRGLLFGHYHLRYAESRDGIQWTFPRLGLYAYKGNKDNNIVFAHPRFEAMEMKESRRTNWIGSPAPVFLNEQDMPAADRRGYKYLLTYPQSGGGSQPAERNQVFLIGSQDGIHWDHAHRHSLGLFGISDGWFGMVYDPRIKKYVAYVRPRDRYQRTGNSQNHVDFEPNDFVYTGVVRRVARIENADLWSEWKYSSQSVMLTDDRDRRNGSTALMCISVRYHAGIYFGFLEPFVPRQKIWTELTLSRDGREFERLHEPVVAAGSDGAWDTKQAWASSDWLEVGNEWWIYYWASNREPNTPIRSGRQSIGLAKIRREGFLSMGIPEVGGVVVTRRVTWPGGDLRVNADSQGEMRVRVSDERRDSIAGFDYKDCVPFTGNRVSHAVAWRGHSLDELKGRDLRLEFYFARAGDLYSFRATGSRGAN